MRNVKKTIAYVAIRGDPSGRFYVYRYVVVSPAGEEGCGVVCSGCGGDKVWYAAIQIVVEKLKSRYGEVELRTHFSHLAKGLFRMEVGEGVTVKYVEEKENLALKGIDKCLAKALVGQLDLHRWQREFVEEFNELLVVEEMSAVALSAPTGSGKTKATLEALRLAVDRKLASMAVAVGRTKTQLEAFIRDNEQFGVGFLPVRLPSKESACIQIRMAPPPSPDWDEEEKREYLAMLARRAKCNVCPLNFNTVSIEPDALRRIVVETTNDMRSADDKLYVEELESKLREEVVKRLGPVAAERGGVCAYSAVKNAAAYMVARGEPVLALGTYPHIFSHARVLLLNMCRPGGDSSEDGEEEDDVEECQAAVAVDEAHNLWKVAIDYNKYSIFDVRILKVAEDLAAYCGEHPKESWCAKLGKLVGVLHGSAEVLGKYVEQNSGRKIRRDAEVKVLDPPDALVKTLEGLSTALEEVCMPYLDETGNLARDDRRIARACTLMKTAKRFLKVLKGEETRWGIYSIIDRRRRSLVLLPVDLRGMVSRARETFRGPWILLSGTMGRADVEKLLGGDVYFYRASVKFGSLSVRFAVSRDVNLLTTRYDVGRNEDMYKKYAVAISRVLRGAAGPLRLAVYPSYSVMEDVRRHYAPPGDAEERWESPGEKFKAEIEELLEEGRPVNLHAVAHGSFAEGIEFKLKDGRSAIGTVVAAGIPVPNIFSDYYVDVAKHFGYLDDKCAESLHRAPDFAATPEECRTKMIEWGYTLAETALRQIIGRAIRGPQDSATLYLLDTRIAVVPRLRDSLCRGLHYHVECSNMPAEELLNTI